MDKSGVRALNRMGYQIVMKAEPDFFVQASEKSWTLYLQNSSEKFQSIYDLLMFLEK